MSVISFRQRERIETYGDHREEDEASSGRFVRAIGRVDQGVDRGCCEDEASSQEADDL